MSEKKWNKSIKREIECINAMAGIKNPKEFVEAVNKLEDAVLDTIASGVVAGNLETTWEALKKAKGKAGENPSD